MERSRTVLDAGTMGPEGSSSVHPLLQNILSGNIGTIEEQVVPPLFTVDRPQTGSKTR